jgi:hypothetical protein
MRPLDALAPDQRAVVTLLLHQGRTYDDIAAVLGIRVAAVRERAYAGLAALAPANGLPGEVTAPLADYLLGQQSPADAAATRGLLAESAPLRTWASGVAGALAGEAPGGLPEVPGAPVDDAAEAPPDVVAREEVGAAPQGDDVPAAPADVGPRDEVGAALERDDVADPSDELPRPGPPAPSSRLGGAVLIAGIVAVIAVVLFLVLRGGDEPEPGAVPPAATATPTPAPAAARVTDQIDLRPVGGGRASGRMTVFLQEGRLLFQLMAEGLRPSGGAAYAVWFTGPGSRARRLGFTDAVGRDGALGIQGPSDTDLEAFPRLYASYTAVVVSRETDASAPRPGDPVLRGPLPRGRRG